MADDQDEAPERPEDDVEMTFFEHLAELRTRLIRALIGIVPGMGLAWYFKERLLEYLAIPWNRAHASREGISAEQLAYWLTHPFKAVGDDAVAEPATLHFTNPMDPFIAYLVMAAVAGLILASPWVFWQMWGFISPGLYRREKRLAIPFVLVSTLFFVSGCYFGYALVLPLAYQTFMAFGGPISEQFTLQEMVTIDEYLTLTSRLLIAFGITFEVPVVITFLSFAKLVNWRQLLKFARWWLLISVVLAALLTPPDPGSQLMMAVPLNVLYWVSILLAMLFGPKAPKPGELTEDGYER
jgi:sec-independent protein translocase protein TatC